MNNENINTNKDNINETNKFSGKDLILLVLGLSVILAILFTTDTPKPIDDNYFLNNGKYTVVSEEMKKENMNNLKRLIDEQNKKNQIDKPVSNAIKINIDNNLTTIDVK